MARKISEEEEARALPAGAEPISRRRETKNSLVDDRSMQLAGAAMDVVCTALTAGKWDHRSRRGGEGEARAVGDDEPRGGGRYRSRVARGGVSEGSSGGGHLRPAVRAERNLTMEPVRGRTRERGSSTAVASESDVTRARTHRSTHTKRYMHTALCRLDWLDRCARPRVVSLAHVRRETNASALDLSLTMTTMRSDIYGAFSLFWTLCFEKCGDVSEQL
jgi:hypothetical protein